MTSTAQQKIFRIERHRQGPVAAVTAIVPSSAQMSDEALREIRDLISALDVKVSALPQLEEIEERLVKDVLDMQGRIQTTKEEIAALRHPKAQNDKFERASLQLDAIVEQTEQATSTILESAEKLEEQISHLRETHPGDAIIDNAADQMIDAITAIYEASNFQDITGQRTRKVVEVLQYIEDRLGRMVNLWGAGEIEAMPLPADDGQQMDDDVALNGPALGGGDGEIAAISQDDIDALFD